MDRSFFYRSLILTISIALALTGCKNTSSGTVEFDISKGMLVRGENTVLSWKISENFDIVSLRITELKEGGRNWNITETQYHAGTLTVAPLSTTEYALSLVILPSPNGHALKRLFVPQTLPG